MRSVFSLTPMEVLIRDRWRERILRLPPESPEYLREASEYMMAYGTHPAHQRVLDWIVTGVTMCLLALAGILIWLVLA